MPKSESQSRPYNRNQKESAKYTVKAKKALEKSDANKAGKVNKSLKDYQKSMGAKPYKGFPDAYSSVSDSGSQYERDLGAAEDKNKAKEIRAKTKPGPIARPKNKPKKK